jgi:hypothetical protein
VVIRSIPGELTGVDIESSPKSIRFTDVLVEGLDVDVAVGAGADVILEADVGSLRLLPDPESTSVDSDEF